MMLRVLVAAALVGLPLLVSGALAQTLFVLNGLQVDEKKMRANLDLTKGLIVS